MNNLLRLTTQKIENLNMIAWIFNHEIKTERGLPVDFERFSFMIDPYLDWNPEQGTRKCSQIGWSTMTNFKLFYAAKYGIPNTDITAANVIYTLPTDKDVSDFVSTKTNKIIENNAIISEYVSDVDSIQRKMIGNSALYFKGTKSKSAALMITSDLNIHDEADRSEKSIVDQYESRLANSTYKGKWIFSNPSAPNMPADLLFQTSDQKYWFIKCPYCGQWQYMDWVKLSENEFKKAIHCYIDDENEQFVCGKCCRPIPDEVRQRGQWIPRFQGRKASGYWVSHLMCSWISAADLLATERNKDRGYFKNFVLGLPYVGSDVVVDEQTIVNNLVLTEIKWIKGKVAMGIDNGDIKHYVIGNEQGIFEYGKTRDWDVIEQLIRKYDPYFIIDLNPYPNKPKEIVTKYRKGWCSFYLNTPKQLEMISWGKRHDINMVYPQRDRVIDDLVNYIVDGNLKFIGSKSYYESYISHWLTMYRADMINSQKVEGSLSNEDGLKTLQKVWLSSTGDDHWCHATVYFYIALGRLLKGQGMVMGSGESLGSKEKDAGVKRGADITDGKMKPLRNYINDLSKMIAKKDKKSSAISGKM